MKLKESGEMYLETVYILSRSGEVRSIDIAEKLGYSRPSVSRAIRVLEKDGYLSIGEKSRVKLTEKGLALARTTYERHRTLKSLLLSLGVNEEIAENDACRIEHVISEETFDAIKNKMKASEETKTI